jgi:hypothetical protein
VNTNMMHEGLAESQPGKADLPRSGAQAARSWRRILLLRSGEATRNFLRARRQDSRGKNDPSAVGPRGGVLFIRLIAAIRGA